LQAKSTATASTARSKTGRACSNGCEQASSQRSFSSFDKDVAVKYAKDFAPVRLLTVEDVFGG